MCQRMPLCYASGVVHVLVWVVHVGGKCRGNRVVHKWCITGPSPLSPYPIALGMYIFGPFKAFCPPPPRPMGGVLRAARALGTKLV